MEQTISQISTQKDSIGMRELIHLENALGDTKPIRAYLFHTDSQRVILFGICGPNRSIIFALWSLQFLSRDTNILVIFAQSMLILELKAQKLT